MSFRFFFSSFVPFSVFLFFTFALVILLQQNLANRKFSVCIRSIFSYFLCHLVGLVINFIWASANRFKKKCLCVCVACCFPSIFFHCSDSIIRFVLHRINLSGSRLKIVNNGVFGCLCFVFSSSLWCAFTRPLFHWFIRLYHKKKIYNQFGWKQHNNNNNTNSQPITGF